MSQTIITRYHGPTNYRGSRISATCWRGKVVLSYDHTLNSADNHLSAAQSLCRKLNEEAGQQKHWVILAEGDMPNKKDMCYVIAHLPEVCV